MIDIKKHPKKILLVNSFPGQDFFYESLKFIVKLKINSIHSNNDCMSK